MQVEGFGPGVVGKSANVSCVLVGQVSESAYSRPVAPSSVNSLVWLNWRCLPAEWEGIMATSLCPSAAPGNAWLLWFPGLLEYKGNWGNLPCSCSLGHKEDVSLLHPLGQS